MDKELYELKTKRIFTIFTGATMLILSVVALIYVAGPTYASENGAKSNFSAPMQAGGGKIMMDYTSVHVPSQDKTYYECIVWDTETGKSRLYFYSYNDKKFKSYEDNVQLPPNPLP